MPCWVDTEQPDPEAGARFYGELFGWEVHDRMPPGSPVRYLVAQLRGRDVAGVTTQQGAAATATWNTYVAVESADDAATTAVEAGGRVLLDPFDVLDEGRMAVLADPSGGVFCVWQARGSIGSQLVNEPGTWNFSELHTRDPESARAFYAALFGWEAEDMDLGAGDTTLWRLPGYGDYLEERDPGLRSRMAAARAPSGFEDAVAWLVPMSGEGVPDDAPARWNVSFAVADTDALAARAAELGGEITVPPFDVPFVRMAVRTDPQGAEFTVGKYVPPT